MNIDNFADPNLSLDSGATRTEVGATKRLTEVLLIDSIEQPWAN